MKVLIADDNTISCRALANNIDKWGYEVVTARNGQEAWEAVNEKHGTHKNGSIRIALLDWEMPKINGIELCQRIRGRRRVHSRDYVYIILMTGRDHQEDILQGLAAGADDYMTKPFDYVELKIRLQNGERIHDDYALTNKTGAGKKEGPEPMPIKLQGHHNPVKFRNIWIQRLKLKPAKKAVLKKKVTPT